MSNYVLESPGIYRCKGCGHGVRTREPDSIRGCLCKSLGECVHLGEPTGEKATCKGCQGEVQIKVFCCAIHGTCLPFTKKKKTTDPPVHKCDGCQQRES